jgi:hypothetical protein
MTIIRSYNFSKFKRLFAKGLNPFKIQTRFKLDLLMNFIIQNPESFGSWANRKVVPFEITFHHAKFGRFWTSGTLWLLISKFELWKIFINWRRIGKKA